MSTSTALNTRDAALLDILSSETNRKLIAAHLSIPAFKSSDEDLTLLRTFAEALNAEIRYVLSADGLTLTDTTTGLMWQQAGSDKSYTHKGAEEYVQSLNDAEFGGYTDWRLPTYHELPSIVDVTRSNPAIDPAFKCRSDWYWTGTVRASSPDCAWIVYFHDGFVDGYRRDNDHAFVRAVRAASPAGQ